MNGLSTSSEPHQIGQEYPPLNESEWMSRMAADASERIKVQGQTAPPAYRDQHPKSHGYLQGEFTVHADLPDRLRHGIFAAPATYPCWVRFSNASPAPSGQLESDWDEANNRQKDGGRGIAIKLLGVPGEFLSGGDSCAGEQDFLAINSKVFIARNVEEYSRVITLLAKLKRLASGAPDSSLTEEDKAQMQRFEDCIKIAGRMASQKIVSPLEIDYWSATPYRLGNAAMKYHCAPVQADMAADPSTLSGDRSHYLRDAIKAHLRTHDASFDFRIQIQTDAEAMPIEDPTIEWSEQLSPFVTVARLHLPAQEFDTQARRAADERQSFSPWHALAAHRPLGGINRARQMYGRLANDRNQMNAAH